MNQKTPDRKNVLRVLDATRGHHSEIFEYWAHAAAFLPVGDFRFSLPSKHAIRSGQIHWYRNPDRKLMGELLRRIRSEGPIRSRDIETGTAKRAGWCDWKPAKKALEQLYMQGDLMVRDREGFQKTYDLTERVLPSHVNTEFPGTDEFAEHIVDQQLRCHGLVSLKGLTYQRRNPASRKAVKALVNERLAQGFLAQVKLDSGEMFLPAALYRDQFVGRMDCKAHRKARLLEVKSLHFALHGLDEDLVATAFMDAIAMFCQFQECDTVRLNEAYPKHLAQRLGRELESLG